MIPRRRFLSFLPALLFLRPAKAVVPAKKPPPLMSTRELDERLAALKVKHDEVSALIKKLNYRLLSFAQSIDDSQYGVVTLRETP